MCDPSISLMMATVMQNDYDDKVTLTELPFTTYRREHLNGRDR